MVAEAYADSIVVPSVRLGATGGRAALKCPRANAGCSIPRRRAADFTRHRRSDGSSDGNRWGAGIYMVLRAMLLLESYVVPIFRTPDTILSVRRLRFINAMKVFVMHVGHPGNVDLEWTVTRCRRVDKLLEQLPSDAPERSVFEDRNGPKASFPNGNFNCWGVPERAAPGFRKTQIGEV